MSIRSVLLGLGGIVLVASAARAQVYIQEYCNDPFGPLVGIDCNADGTAATSGAQSDDEFVEIVNAGPGAVDISNWTLSDSTALRHTFAVGTLLPAGSAIVVFGGGSVANFNTLGCGTGVLATTGTLGLNNSGPETVVIKDGLGATIDTYTFGNNTFDDGDGESVTRNPEAPGATLARHTTVTAGVPHSAGKLNDGATCYGQAGVVPATYQGNGADCDIDVRVNNIPDNTATSVHTVVAGNYVSLKLGSPTGSLNYQPFLLVFDTFVTGFPVTPIQLPGDAAPSIWMNPLTTQVIIDGFGPAGLPFAPILVPEGYVAAGQFPPVMSGLGLSLMVQMLVVAPGFNPVNIGVADAHEFIVL